MGFSSYYYLHNGLLMGFYGKAFFFWPFGSQKTDPEHGLGTDRPTKSPGGMIRYDDPAEGSSKGGGSPQV